MCRPHCRVLVVCASVVIPAATVPPIAILIAIVLATGVDMQRSL